MFHEILKKIQSCRGIKSSEIVEIADIQSTQLSEFRNGKSDISSRKLWSILEAMETIDPGAKANFCQAIANFEDRAELNIDPVELIDSCSEEQLNEILLAIANRYRRESQSRKEAETRKSTEGNKLAATV